MPAGVSWALLTTWSTKPYSLASCAVYQWSRSASLRIFSRGWPVCRAVSSDSVFFTKRICSAWILMSVAVPPMPPDGWCIRIVEFGMA